MDTNVISHIIRYIEPHCRNDAIIGFDHQKSDGFHQFIMDEESLRDPQTYTDLLDKHDASIDEVLEHLKHACNVVDVDSLIATLNVLKHRKEVYELCPIIVNKIFAKDMTTYFSTVAELFNDVSISPILESAVFWRRLLNEPIALNWFRDRVISDKLTRHECVLINKYGDNYSIGTLTASVHCDIFDDYMILMFLNGGDKEVFLKEWKDGCIYHV